MIKITALVLAFVAYSSMAAAQVRGVVCPKKAGEKVLTLERVMYNFRDYLEDPDHTAIQGISNPSSVTDQQIAKAIADLEVTIACANEVANSESPNLLPQDAQKLQGQARMDYINRFHIYFDELEEALTKYQSLYQALANLPAEQRSFRDVEDQSLEVRAVENEGHHKF